MSRREFRQLQPTDTVTFKRSTALGVSENNTACGDGERKCIEGARNRRSELWNDVFGLYLTAPKGVRYDRSSDVSPLLAMPNRTDA